jgi:hypothetical protein
VTGLPAHERDSDEQNGQEYFHYDPFIGALTDDVVKKIYHADNCTPEQKQIQEK